MPSTNTWTESDKDYYIHDIIEGDTILMPSKLYLIYHNWKRDFYEVVLDGYFQFLEREFEVPRIIPNLNLDLV